MMLPSGNDSAQVLAENVGAWIYMENKQGYLNKKMTEYNILKEQEVVKKCAVQTFIRELNVYAIEFDLRTTKFTNAHGMDMKDNKVYT